MLEVHHSGREPLICSLGNAFQPSLLKGILSWVVQMFTGGVLQLGLSDSELCEHKLQRDGKDGVCLR